MFKKVAIDIRFPLSIMGTDVPFHFCAYRILSALNFKYQNANANDLPALEIVLLSLPCFWHFFPIYLFIAFTAFYPVALKLFKRL